MSFFTTCASVRPLPELIQGAHDVHAQLLAHLYATDVGVEDHDDGIWTKLSRWNAVQDPLEPPDVVAQGLARVLLQSVEVEDCCRVRRAAGLEGVHVMAFHFFPGAASGV